MGYWPDATNTGVPDGVVLDARTGDISVTKAGTVLSNLNIRGSIHIQADNVTIENCNIVSSSFWGVYIHEGVTGAVVQDCDIDGLGRTGKGIAGQGTFLRNNIRNVEDGIDVRAGNTLIEGNYIHDLSGYAGAHFDGINIEVGNVTVRHNTVINEHGQTSVLFLESDWGVVRNVLVEDNLLVGGGYTIYALTGNAGAGTLVDVRFVGNHYGSGAYGTFNTNTTVTQSGNLSDGARLVAGLSETGPYVPSNPADPGPGIPDPTPTPDRGATEGDDSLSGDANANVISGLGGNDRVNGGAGNDTLSGGAGSDTLVGGLGRDSLAGGPGNDMFVFGSAGESVPSSRDLITDFTPGQDKIDLGAIDANSGTTVNDDFTFLPADGAAFTKRVGELAWHTDTANNRTIIQGDVNGDGVSDFDIQLSGSRTLTAKDFVGLANVTAPAPTPTNAMVGTWRADRIAGTNSNEIIDGRGGNDRLSGGTGDDLLIGGTGMDVLTGGAGRDVFLFTAVNETGGNAGTRDVITDFDRGQDKIDLSGIDANSGVSGNDAFRFVSGDDTIFSKKAGEIAWHTENGITVIQGDINGDGRHDFEIQLTGNIPLTADDFIL